MSGQILLDLPIVAQGDDEALASLYGADAVAAAYCGFSRPPVPPFGIWNHGWLSEYRMVHPDAVAGNFTGARQDQTYWVGRKDQEEYMQAQGFRRVRAIGMPITYLPPIAPRREAGSLLVMPPHIVPYVTAAWDARAYVEAIDAIRSDFEKVVVCVHPSCWQRGLWVDDFKKAGYEVIRGLEGEGAPTPLHSMQAIFSRFECVTTNGYGSHLAYASYFGARVSIYGPIAQYDERHLANILVFKRNPAMWKNALAECSEAGMRRNHPDFFTHPKEAPQRLAWAARELGEDCKVSPAEMKRLFKWTFPQVAAFRAKNLGARVVRNLPPKARKLALRSLDRRFRAEDDELARLYGMKPFLPGESSLMGLPFSFVDVHSFLFTHGELITRQIYRFVTAVEEPRIIDCGANIGLSVLYFKSLHPRSRILAFEPDPAVFATLKKNVETLGLEGVTLRQAAVWIDEGTVPFRRQGGDSGRIASSEDEPGTVAVPKVRLKDFLKEPVQFLKIDIEGAEVDVIESCVEELRNVERIFVEYHSFVDRPQHLDRLFAGLTRAGFRLHIVPFNPAPHPLLYLNIRTGIDAFDMTLNVFGFRE